MLLLCSSALILSISPFDHLRKRADGQPQTLYFPFERVTVAQRKNQGFSSSPFGYIVLT